MSCFNLTYFQGFFLLFTTMEKMWAKKRSLYYYKNFHPKTPASDGGEKKKRKVVDKRALRADVGTYYFSSFVFFVVACLIPSVLRSFSPGSRKRLMLLLLLLFSLDSCLLCAALLPVARYEYGT